MIIIKGDWLKHTEPKDNIARPASRSEECSSTLRNMTIVSYIVFLVRGVETYYMASEHRHLTSSVSTHQSIEHLVSYMFVNAVVQSVRGGSKSVSSPRQLLQGDNEVFQLVSSSACPFPHTESVKKPAGDPEQKTAVTTGGTGVFLPAYCTRISHALGNDVKSNEGQFVILSICKR